MDIYKYGWKDTKDRKSIKNNLEITNTDHFHNWQLVTDLRDDEN